jgi:hypothetical protein
MLGVALRSSAEHFYAWKALQRITMYRDSHAENIAKDAIGACDYQYIWIDLL